MKVLVCGSRDWTNVYKIRDHLSAMPAGTIIVHGAAQGADTIAGNIAKELGFPVREYQPDWMSLGRFAGPVRNATMLKEEHPDRDGVLIDLVIAFIRDPKKSRGTSDMIKKAQSAKIPVKKVLW